jgi:hypothetical protein
MHDPFHNTISSGVVGNSAIDGFIYHNLSTNNGSCGSLIYSNDHVIGFHTATDGTSNMFQPITDEVIKFFRTTGVVSLANVVCS